MCKETMKMTSHQIEDANKEIGIVKRKKKRNSGIENLTRGVQHKI